MIFISHTHRDLEFAKEIERLLSLKGYSVWLDNRKIPVGEEFVIAISEALFSSNIFLLIDSGYARSSYWVGREKATASRLRKNGMLVSTVGLLVEQDLPKDSFRLDHVLSKKSILHKELYEIIEYSSTQHTLKHGDNHKVDIYYAHPYARHNNWIGYSDAMRMIDKWWHSRKLGLWISGLGGIGKTSLINTWLISLMKLGYEEPQNVSVMFWSFYENSSSDLAIASIRTWLEETKSIAKLVVIDGMERVEQDGTITEIVRTTLDTHKRIKVIVSSRNLLPKFLKPQFGQLLISGLTHQEAQILFERVGAEASLAFEISQKLNGHPLATRLAMGLITKGENPKEILRLLDGR